MLSAMRTGGVRRSPPKAQGKASCACLGTAVSSHPFPMPTTQARHTPGPRPVKAVVFSQHDVDLQSVAEHLYDQFGPTAIAEHWGRIADASTELSRFRNGVKEARRCPVCGGLNGVYDTSCGRTLLEAGFALRANGSAG